MIEITTAANGGECLRVTEGGKLAIKLPGRATWTRGGPAGVTTTRYSNGKVVRVNRTDSDVAGLAAFSHPVLASLILLVAILTSGVARADTGPAPGDGPYMVFAHYMPCFKAFGFSKAGNSGFEESFAPTPGHRGGYTSRPVVYPVGTEDPQLDAIISDIRIAKSYGIDGFLVDELDDTPSYDHEWQLLLSAADQVGDFKIGIMPDYATIGSPSSRMPASREKIKDWVDLGMSHSSFLRYDGKPVVFSYAVGYPNSFDTKLNEPTPVGEKRDLVDWMAQQGEPISYAPNMGISWPVYSFPYANDPTTGFQTFSFSEGTFSPMAALDKYDVALRYWPKSLMITGEDSFIYYNRTWHYSTGEEDLSGYYRDHWMWNIAHRDRLRWIMLVTWNDWGETAIAPV